MAVIQRRGFQSLRRSSLFWKLTSRNRLVPSISLVVVVLLASLMGNANGGYFTGDWTPAAFFMAALLLVISVTGMLRVTWSRWSALAVGLFAAYAAWTLLSLLWSPNRGDAWAGAGVTLLYLLTFCLTVTLVALGASRRWVLAASCLGPAVVAGFTLTALGPQVNDLFGNNRLLGTVGYYNGEAAFLLVPLWVSVYLAGSGRVNPALRGLVLAGAVLSVAVAVLAQSRGAMLAMILSVPVFFLFSGQRLRGLLALAPVVAALLVNFPGLNDVYLAFQNQGAPEAAIHRVVPTVWLAAAGAGLYGCAWGLIDRRWRPSAGTVRVVGSAVLAGTAVVLVLATVAFNERVGDPISWSGQKWEAFKSNDTSGQQQSRYLSASGSGRYALWEVAWEDFVSHPVLGVGTHNYEATYYRLREGVDFHARQPHSLPLEVLGERGIVGGLLFFGFLTTSVTVGLRRRFGHLNAEGKAQVGAVIAALTYWFVHSSAEWFWQLPAVTMPAISFLGLLVAPWERAGVVPAPWPLRAVGAGIAALTIVLVTPLYVADRYLAQGELAGDPRTGLQSIELAQRFNPLDPDLPQREAELALRAGDWSRAADSYSRAIRLDPENYAPYYLLALLHEKRGEYEKAVPLYRKAASLNPGGEEIDVRLRRLHARAGLQSQPTRAERVADRRDQG